jgi:hypothetical protein
MAIVCIGMMLTACEKEKVPSPTKKPTAQLKSEERIIAAFFQENRDHNTVHIQFDADQGGQFLIEGSNTEIIIEGGGLRTVDGQPVHGPIDMGVLQTFDRSDMWQNNRTTMSRSGNGGIEGFALALTAADADDPADADEGVMLATGGAFDITMTSLETGDVVVAPDGVVTVKVDASLTGGPNSQAVLWDGQPGVQQDDNDWTATGEAPGVDNGMYTWTWTGMPCNIDWSVDWGLPTTELIADLPTVFNDQNAEIFVAFPGYPNMMASMDQYDQTIQKWREHGMYANQGQTLHFVAVGIYNGVLYAGIQTATLGGPTHTENISMSPMTPAQIDQAILALP